MIHNIPVAVKQNKPKQEVSPESSCLLWREKVESKYQCSRVMIPSVGEKFSKRPKTTLGMYDRAKGRYKSKKRSKRGRGKGK
jgi:hypothetical protein